MSNNITYEELAKRFRVRKLQGFGRVIIVPGDKFDPDWEAQLGEGYECIEHTYYKKPVTLIRKVVKEKAAAETKKKTDDEKPIQKIVTAATEGDLLELRAHCDKRIDVLSESQAALKKSLNELQKQLDKLTEAHVQHCNDAEEVNAAERLTQLEQHEHSLSGKIMVPLKKNPP